MKIPKVIENLIESFEKLPGIGPKTAQRLTFYLLHVPQSELESFAQNLTSLKKETVLCSVCKNVAENDPCSICSDPSRDKQLVMIIEQPLDILAIERGGKYKGVYHVLHGAINPLENIGPEELYIDALVARVGRSAEGEARQGWPAKVSEVVIATNPTMEGDATAMYIAKQLKAQDENLKITRLGVGIPTGADIEYADEMTIMQAIEGRRAF